jgi:hypothetical protein
MSRSELYTFVPAVFHKSNAYKNLYESARANNVKLTITFTKQEAGYECRVYLDEVCFGTGQSFTKHRARKIAANEAMTKLMTQYPSIRVKDLSSYTYCPEKMQNEDWLNYVERSTWEFILKPTIDVMLLSVFDDEQRKNLQELFFRNGYQSSYDNGLVRVTQKTNFVAIYLYLKTHKNDLKYEIYMDI